MHCRLSPSVGVCFCALLAAGISKARTSGPIEGYTRDDAMALYHNSVHLPVTWVTKASVADLAGRPVKIRLLMRDCKLYALQYRPPAALPLRAVGKRGSG